MSFTDIDKFEQGSVSVAQVIKDIAEVLEFTHWYVTASMRRQSLRKLLIVELWETIDVASICQSCGLKLQHTLHISFTSER